MTEFRAAPLTKQVVAITGGTSGIGLATARLLAAKGAQRILLVGRDQARGTAAAAAVNAAAAEAGHATTHAHFHQGDVAQPETADALAGWIDKNCDGLDAVVTAAGGNHPPRLFHALPDGAAEAIVNEWLLGTIHVLRRLMPLLKARGGGSVVTVASDAAKVATPGEAVIGAAMAGIVMLSRTLAMEGTRSGIRVNCLTPSLIEGTITFDTVMSDAFSQRLFGKARERARLGLSTAEDQANLVLFLLGPESRRLTGQAISVNGGISAA